MKTLLALFGFLCVSVLSLLMFYHAVLQVGAVRQIRSAAYEKEHAQSSQIRLIRYFKFLEPLIPDVFDDPPPEGQAAIEARVAAYIRGKGPDGVQPRDAPDRP